MQALIKKRGIIKGKLTRASNSAEEYFSDEAAITLWFDTITKLENDFEEVQSKIDELYVPIEGQDDPQETERDHFEKAVFEFKLKLKQKLAQFASTEIPSVISTATCSNPAHPAIPRVKLQKIDLPKFSGDWRQWPSFYQLFTKLVHDDPAYTTVEKFFQLAAHLTGEAAERIEGIDILAENYEDALNALKERYDNQRLVITKHLRIICELPMANTDAQLRSLVDTFQKSLRALSAQGLPTDQWDALLLYIISTRLSQGIRRQWEITIENSRLFPSLSELISFLEQRATAAEVIAATSNAPEKRPAATNATSAAKVSTIDAKQQPKRDIKYTHVSTQNSCPICKELHYPYQCKTFGNSSLAEREKLVSKNKLCGNCLNPNHTTAKCRSTKCKRCGNLHHTSLHKDNASSKPLNPDASTFTGLAAQPPTTTFLPTACVYASHNQRKIPARIVIDSASQSTLITDNLARQLKLKPTEISVNIEGVGGSCTTAPRFAVELTLKSRHSDYRIDISAKVLPIITHYRPVLDQDVVKLLHEPGLPLADEYNNDLPIDILLGAEYWSTIMQAGKLEVASHIPPLLNSSFGWLASGNLSCSLPEPTFNECCCFTLEAQLRQFWELEDVTALASLSPNKEMTPDEKFCEQNFVETTSRDASGRYIVTLPFNEKIVDLGESRQFAERQFLQIEKRMQRDQQYREHYHAFMREYEALGHMTEIDSVPPGPHYFLPHHAVMRPDDPSKFRVVFNGSQETTTGVSLNDTLRTGPVVQRPLATVLGGFRKYLVAFTTDVVKMYRQILLHQLHRIFHLILWRYHQNDTLGIRKLNTVTYGVRPSSFLATRTLKQLAIDEQEKYPLAARVLLEEDYVDDVASGADSIEEAINLINELIALASSGQFQLSKWSYNKLEALANIPDNATISKTYSFDKDAQCSKVLGMVWETEADILYYRSSLPDIDGKLTKRKLLSYLSRIFDPLGLIAPITIVAK